MVYGWNFSPGVFVIQEVNYKQGDVRVCIAYEVSSQRAYYFCYRGIENNVQQINNYGTKKKSRTGWNF